MKSGQRYTYRQDPDVPSFPDGGAVTVMDAQCGLCSWGARWIAWNDAQHSFRIVPFQSPLGQSLMCHYDLDPVDPMSWLFIENGMAYGEAEAVIRVASRLGGPWHALSILKIFPASFLNWLYRQIAKSRYRIFGHADLCALPDPKVQERLLQ